MQKALTLNQAAQTDTFGLRGPATGEPQTMTVQGADTNNMPCQDGIDPRPWAPVS